MQSIIRFVSGLSMLGFAAAALGEPLYIDPNEAADREPDFAIQGEYVNESATLGAQVVALGNGHFDVFILSGGLPGDGFDGEHRQRASKEAVQFGEGKFTLVKDDGESHTFKRIERESRTLGKKPPEGAIVLFDGSDVDAWHNGEMDDKNLLKQGTTSRQHFGDHTLHVEFLVPYRPEARGQRRGNSGVYMQGRYEVQILDSFGLVADHDDGGGIYSVSKPKVNMCYPPLTWQTYDIKVTSARFDDDGNKTANAKLTVYHNGVKIHDEVQVPGPTTAAPVNNEVGGGPVFLQNHGNPVRFRNIWVVEH